MWYQVGAYLEPQSRYPGFLGLHVEETRMIADMTNRYLKIGKFAEKVHYAKLFGRWWTYQRGTKSGPQC